MLASDIAQFARQLVEARGPKAEALAARRAKACEAKGDRPNAEAWRRVQQTISRMGPPHAS